MNRHQAILLFIRDEREENRLKPLPRIGGRRINYGLINRALARKVGQLSGRTDLIVCSTGSAHPFGSSHVILQSGTTFGERITDAVEQVFGLGYDQVTIIGNDCPTLTLEDITLAFGRLTEGSSIAAAPAVDGGAFLIAINRKGFDPVLFRELPWQTGELFDAICSLPSSTPLPVKRSDFDQWDCPEGVESLLSFLGYLTRSNISSSIRTGFVLPSELRKSLTRFFLTAPPLSIVPVI